LDRLAFLANIRLGWKSSPGAKTLAYHKQITPYKAPEVYYVNFFSLLALLSNNLEGLSAVGYCSLALLFDVIRKRLSKDKRCSLFVWRISEEGKHFHKIGTKGQYY
jgi:hypothetical protein